jgi:hypothetical protein
MSNVSSINLGNLSVNKSHSAVKLLNLAQYANGPLRLQKKVENGNTVIHLGVRSWSTYFFEKLIATPAQVAKAKLKTQVAIDRDIRSFLHKSGMTMGPSHESIVADLQMKVLGKSILPAPASWDGISGNANAGPNYRPPEVVQTTGKLFHGSGTVPTGLSVAVVSPLQIIADVRLVAEGTFGSKTVADQRRGKVYSMGQFPDIGKTTSANVFKKYYLEKLNAVAAFVQTSAVMELALDAGKDCSDPNLEGARTAAKEFAMAQKREGKHVSIMLTVPKIPTTGDKNTSTVRTIDAKPSGKPNQFSLTSSDDESSEDESSN